MSEELEKLLQLCDEYLVKANNDLECYFCGTMNGHCHSISCPVVKYYEIKEKLKGDKMPIKRNNIKERITDFSKARVGDKVFDRFMQECGEITNTTYCMTLPIQVYFRDSDKTEIYTIKGNVLVDHMIPALIWAEQKPEDDWSILPEMPKRMVKKKIEGWINIYLNKGYGNIYPSKEEAIKQRCKYNLGEPLFISHEYEVEED